MFRDGFEHAGWRWGRPPHYVLAIGLALFLWLVPVVIENVSGLRTDAWEPRWTTMLVSFITSFAITLLPAFGEEFSWRGYLLPRLLERFTPRRALLFHGFVTWLWHVPFIVTMGFQLGGALVFARVKSDRDRGSSPTSLRGRVKPAGGVSGKKRRGSAIGGGSRA